MSTVPSFPLVKPYEDWSDLELLAAVIYGEAEGEPNEGKVGVGWVVMHRVHERGQPVKSTILAPFQFSIFNEDYRPRLEARLATADGDALEQSWRAAAGALWKLITDPTDGANHYLQVELTKRQRRDKTLPAWAADPKDPTKVNAAKVTAVLGNHTFLRV